MSLYNNFYSQSVDILPLQNIPLKDKLAPTYNGSEKSWKEQCMDSLENIGKRQFSSNLKLIENYEMIKGRFIPSHYFHTEGYSSAITDLAAQFELPNYLRHYDIISQVVNQMSAEWLKRPDIFKFVELGDGGGNAYLRTKLELTQQYVAGQINAEINKKLIEQGLDPNKQDFNSPEEQQQYQQQIQQSQQQLTPIEIQKFMDTDFLTQAEIWANHQHEHDKEYFNFPEKEKVEIEDMMIADRCYRHFYISPTGHQQETWNPVNVFSHTSPDVVYAEDGDYIGRIFNISINTIIDRYGHMMTKEDHDALIGTPTKKDNKWVDSKYNWVYDNYMVPFKDYPTYDKMRNHWNRYQDGSLPFLDENFTNIASDDAYVNNNNGFYFVTEAYWKTQKKLFKLTYQDPETGQLAVDIVDENIIMPKDFVESKNPFADEHDINTYVETTVNEVWKGIKINTRADKTLNKDIYIAVQPNEFQFKGDINIYGCKLPVCGQIFSIRNSKSNGLVDKMKPHQIGHNVAMNQLYQLAEKEIGVFAVMDVNMFPDRKDWGGEDAWSKWMLMAKSIGLLPADTSPANVQNAIGATGGFLPKVMDLNLAAQMVSRMNMAKFFEEQALKQVGFNEYRTGDFSQSSTASGAKQGIDKSYAQTESYFTNFSNYLRRCHQMNLDIAQYVQSHKSDVLISYIKSDLSRGFIKILGTDLLFSEIGVRMSNSQERIRQLDMLRQFALNNNTSGMTPPDYADVILMNNPAEIRRQLQVSYDKLLQQQQQQQQQQQKQHEAEVQVEQQKLADIKENNELNRENELNRARIAAGVAIINSKSDVTFPPDDTPNDQSNRGIAEQNATLKSQKLELDRQRLNSDININQAKMANEQNKTAAALQIQKEQTETAKILKGKKVP